MDTPIIKRLVNESQTLQNKSTPETPTPPITYKKVDTLSSTTMGLLGYSFSCFAYGITALGLTNYDTTSIAVFGVCGGLIQFLSGFFSWYKGENVSSYLSFLYGIYNMLFPLWYYFSKFAYFNGVAYNPDCAGIFNFTYALVTVVVIIISTRQNVISVICNSLVFASFFLQGINAYVNSKALTYIAGGCTMGICLTIGYTGISLFWSKIYGKTILPLFYKGEKVECCC